MIRITEELTEAQLLDEMGDLSFQIVNSTSGDYDRTATRLARLAFAWVHRPRPEQNVIRPVNDPQSVDEINAIRASEGLGPLSLEEAKPYRTMTLHGVTYSVEPRLAGQIPVGTLMALDPKTGYLRPALSSDKMLAGQYRGAE